MSKPVRQHLLKEEMYKSLSKEIKKEKPLSTEISLEKTERKYGELYPMSILVAEDNLVNQKLVKRMLEKLGYHIQLVENGLEAIDCLKAQPYDLVFMDIQMPKMNGLEATHQIRDTFPPEKQPLIIAMTANAMQGDREMCLRAGMNDYISKPFRQKELKKTPQKIWREANVRNPVNCRVNTLLINRKFD